MSDPSQELDAIIAQYLQAIESGEVISREELFAKHPDHADRLAEFLDDLDRVRDAADLPTQSVEEVVLSKPNPDAQSKVIAGRYKLLQKIGAGGMGEVWMADQLEPVKRRVALKLIKAGNNNSKIIARFEAERQALAMMDHPSIARVLDGGTTDDGQPYFVMELVQGLPITQYCDKHRLTIVARLQLFASICEAVHHAHQKGIIHRDLKPTNILVAVYNGKPVPKVIDFGLAKAWGNQPQLTEKTLFTEFGAVVGTLQYMSPEQAELDAVDVDTRADIYALGVLLYELLTGSTPIERETLEQQAVLRVLQSIRETDPPRPSARLSSAGNRLSDISSQRQIDSNKLQSELKGDLDWIVIVNQARESLSNAQKPASVCAAATRLLATWNSTETLLPKPMLVQINVPPKASEMSEPIAFQMSSTEVTAYQFAQFRGATMDGLDGNLPAQNVTLSEAAQYCNWLSQVEGLAEDQWCYQQDAESANWSLKPNALELRGYRLPTRNEFEVAARYSALDDAPTTKLIETVGWTKENASFHLQPVARKLPNAQGLFDLLGNVEEWVHVLPEKTRTEGSEEESLGLAGGAVWLETKYFSSS